MEHAGIRETRPGSPARAPRPCARLPCGCRTARLLVHCVCNTIPTPTPPPCQRKHSRGCGVPSPARQSMARVWLAGNTAPDCALCAPAAALQEIFLLEDFSSAARTSSRIRQRKCIRIDTPTTPVSRCRTCPLLPTTTLSRPGGLRISPEQVWLHYE